MEKRKCFYYHKAKATVFDAEITCDHNYNRYQIKYINENGKEVSTTVSKSNVRQSREKALKLAKTSILEELKELQPRVEKLNNTLEHIEWEIRSTSLT